MHPQQYAQQRAHQGNTQQQPGANKHANLAQEPLQRPSQRGIQGPNDAAAAAHSTSPAHAPSALPVPNALPVPPTNNPRSPDTMNHNTGIQILNLEHTRQWHVRALETYKLASVESERYRQKLVESMEVLTIDEEVAFNQATEKQRAAQLELHAAKLAVKVGEVAQKEWTVAPSPNYIIRLHAWEIKKLLASQNMQPLSSLYPMDENRCTNGQPQSAKQVVTALEQLTRAAADAISALSRKG